MLATQVSDSDTGFVGRWLKSLPAHQNRLPVADSAKSDSLMWFHRNSLGCAQSPPPPGRVRQALRLEVGGRRDLFCKVRTTQSVESPEELVAPLEQLVFAGPRALASVR